MKNLFDYERLMDFLRKSPAILKSSVRIYYLDEHQKTSSGLPEYKIRITFSTGPSSPKRQGGMMGNIMGGGSGFKNAGYQQDFWAIGYHFTKICASGDSLFEGFIESKDFAYLY